MNNNNVIRDRREEMGILCYEVPKDPLEEGMATQSSILAQNISWTEEPSGLWSTGSQRLSDTIEA